VHSRSCYLRAGLDRPGRGFLTSSRIEATPMNQDGACLRSSAGHIVTLGLFLPGFVPILATWVLMSSLVVVFFLMFVLG
jgi:hypothetical protein